MVYHFNGIPWCENWGLSYHVHLLITGIGKNNATEWRISPVCTHLLSSSSMQTWQLAPHANAAEIMAERSKTDITDITNLHPLKKRLKWAAWDYLDIPEIDMGLSMRTDIWLTKNVDAKWLPKEDTCSPIFKNTIPLQIKACVLFNFNPYWKNMGM